MKAISAVLLAGVCLMVYWPHQHSQFVLDDYYTVVRNPLIKDPSLYSHIWNSRLFDAHQSSGYIKFGYYRPLLESSWILDYHLFGLNAAGFQWINLLVHLINCILVFILLEQLFGQMPLALKASILFAVLPAQEWVVRYVTGRGDELSALFALLALIILRRSYLLAFVCWLLAALTREVALSYILYAFLILSLPRREIKNFSLYWILIGILPFLVIGSLVPKLGNILALHLLYFASIGLCLYLAQLRPVAFISVFLLCALVSFYQGRFWTTEKTLLRHTQSLELWPRTVVDQQLLMKYDENIPATDDMVRRSQDPYIKAMWLRRLGQVYFFHGDLTRAKAYFSQSLSVNPLDVDSLDDLAVVYHNTGNEKASQMLLKQSLSINSSYPDTLRLLHLDNPTN